MAKWKQKQKGKKLVLEKIIKSNRSVRHKIDKGKAKEIKWYKDLKNIMKVYVTLLWEYWQPLLRGAKIQFFFFNCSRIVAKKLKFGKIQLLDEQRSYPPTICSYIYYFDKELFEVQEHIFNWKIYQELSWMIYLEKNYPRL